MSEAARIPPVEELRRAPLTAGGGLTLVPLELHHADDLLAAVDSCRPYMERYDEPYRHFRSIDDAYALCMQVGDLWTSGKAAYFAVLREGRLLGQVGLSEVIPHRASATLSYWIREDEAGKGHATTAVRALLRWGFEQCGFRRIEADCHVDNVASQRVLEKLGFKREGTFRESEPLGGGWADHHVYGLLGREYAGSSQ